MASLNNGSWSTGLCGCCDDVGSCCLTFFCPCVAFGRIAEIVDRGATSCCVSGTLYMLLASVTGGWGCLYSCCYRSSLREQYGLKEKPCADCCVHWSCEPCALCQEYRELKNRGFDPSLGWHANMEKMAKSAATVAPQAYSGMTR
ncbi:hypothetical protein ACQJBY_010351 [Aegilops geniculata]